MPFELDAANAEAYLRSREQADAGLRITELGGGLSSTVLLAESGTRRFVLKQALPKLRVQQDWFADRERIFRESDALRALSPLLPPGAVPDVLFEDRENRLFAMTAAPRGAETWKSLLLKGEMRTEISEQIGRVLATIVRASWHNPEWERRFGDQTVFDQLRIDPYYRFTASRHPELRSHIHKLLENSGKRRVSLVHGDWSPKNFLVSGNTVMAIDFEVIHFGDPAFDSAFLLNHLLLKSFYRPEFQEQLAQLARCFWEAYRQGLPPCTAWMEAATIEHLGWLLLARVDGKSPVEYLKDPEARERVRNIAKELILHPPSNLQSIFEW